MTTERKFQVTPDRGVETRMTIVSAEMHEPMVMVDELHVWLGAVFVPMREQIKRQRAAHAL